MKKKVLLPILLVVLCTYISTAQISNNFQLNTSINESGNAPDPSAILDVSSNSKGVLLPRLTVAQRNNISNPAQGLLIFQTGANAGYFYYNESGWESLSSSMQGENVSVGLDGNTLQITDDNGSIYADLSALNQVEEIAIVQALAELALQNADIAQQTINIHKNEDQDLSSTNELNSTLMLTGTVLRLTDAGGTINADLSSIQDGVDDADNNPANELILYGGLDDNILTIKDAGGNTTINLESLDQSIEVSNAQQTADIAQDLALQIQHNLHDHIVNDNDISSTNELITNGSLDGNTLIIEDAGGITSIDLESLDQFVEVSNVQSLAIQNQINIHTHVADDKDIDKTNELIIGASLNGTQLGIKDAGGTTTVNLNTLDESVEVEMAQQTANNAQGLALQNQMNIQNHVSDDLDTNPSNELIINAGLSGNVLRIKDAGGVTSIDLESLDESDEVNNALLHIQNHINEDLDTNSTNELIINGDLDGNTLQIQDAGGVTNINLESLNQSDEVNNAQLTADNAINATLSNQQNIQNHIDNDMDVDNTNEIQFIEYNEMNQSIELSNGGSVDLSFFDNADAIATIQTQLSAHELVDEDLNSSNELIQAIDFNGNALHVTDAGGVKTADLSSLDQTESVLVAQNTADNALLIVANHITDDADMDSNNEIQTLNYTTSSSTLELSEGGIVDLSSLDDSSAILATQYIADEALNLAHNNLFKINDHLSEDGDLDPTNEIELPTGGADGQVLTTNGIGNYTWKNPIINTDQQGLYLGTGSGSIISLQITHGVGVDIDVADNDNDSSNEIQSLSFNPNTNELSLSNGGVVNLSTTNSPLISEYQAHVIEDQDMSSTNELQTISKDGDKVILSNNGGTFTDESVPSTGIIYSDFKNNTNLTSNGFSYIGKTVVNQQNTTVEESWSATSSEGQPSARKNHSSIWNGEHMIIWGGQNAEGTLLNNGASYNPENGMWSEISTLNVPSPRANHKAVWTGNDMIIWGGDDGTGTLTGSKYNPVSDTWTSISTVNQPAIFDQYEMVWTGNELLVFGTTDVSTTIIGGSYDLTSDTWTSISVSNAPSARADYGIAWTGSDIVIWGGVDTNSSFLNSGSKYNPASDTWTSISTINAPMPRSKHVQKWTNNNLIIWGGNTTYGATNTGSLYDPISDTWTNTTALNAPTAKINASSVSTGSNMIVWGGDSYSTKGALYNPVLDIWEATTTENSLGGRTNYIPVWTGLSMIIWGGEDPSAIQDSGSTYTPELVDSSNKIHYMYKKN